MVGRGRRRMRRVRPYVPRNSMGAALPLLRDIRETLEEQSNALPPITRDVQPPRIKAGRIYSFQKSYNESPITGSTSIDTLGAFVFEAQNLTNWVSFADIFDVFRVMNVVVEFVPLTGLGTGGQVVTAIDYNDSNTASLATLLQYDTRQIAQGGTCFSRSVNPRVNVNVYTSPIVSGYGLGRLGQWVNTAGGSTDYYGIKWVIPADANPPAWTVSVRMFVQFKNIR